MSGRNGERWSMGYENLRRLYDETFTPSRGCRWMIEPVVDEVVRLVGRGASEHEILEIVKSDERKAAVLLPLVVALQTRSGERCYAAAEVVEMARDLMRRMTVRTERPGPLDMVWA